MKEELMTDVKLRVPARPEFLHLLRSVVASVGARRNLSYDSLDDLRLAVDEAGAFLLSMKDGGEQLGLRVEQHEVGVAAVVWIDSPVASWPPKNAEDGLAWKVMSGLADEAGFVMDGPNPGIRLVKKAGSVP